MATPFLFGVGAIAAAVAGRSLLRRAGKGAAEEWVKGGFKAKMDRKEAVAILGLKCVSSFSALECHAEELITSSETVLSCDIN